MRGLKRPIGYWNPTTETMPRPALDAFRLRKLQAFVQHAYDRSPYWRRTFDAVRLSPTDIRTLDDVRCVPFLTKETFLAVQAERPPYGDLLAAPADVATTYHQTSGTSGRTPLRAIDSLKDWFWAAEMWAYSMYGFGLRATDILYVAFSYGAFIGFWGAHYGAEKIGATVVPGGGASSEARIHQILDVGATALCCTPTYAWRLAATAEQMGIDLPRQARVDLLIHAGEPGASLPATKKMLGDAWGAAVGDFAGMTELATNFGYTCTEDPGGMHIIEDHFLAEVIDPRSLAPVPYGDRGELVITSLGRGIIPLVRYRTGDLVERVPAGHCTCGRTFDILRGGILGRVDDMKVIRGVNVYPSAVENIVREFPEIDEFQIVLTRQGIVDEITVKIEPKAGAAQTGSSDLVQALSRRLTEVHEGLRFDVEVVAAGSLPRFELKSRRLLDLRQEGT